MSIKPEFKIIADHLRSSSFLVADGVMPSNEGRGYVLRRIMRRAMRQLHKLGSKETTMYKMVDFLIKEMGDAYPELKRGREVIVETLKNEEEKFRETLEKGLKVLEEAIKDSKKGEKFSGAIAFKLYDTYGFPLDLTEDILKEKNLLVDVEEFNSEMEKQRERARKNWVGSGEVAEEKIFFDLREKFGESKFLGYETLTAKAKILEVLDKPHAIILNQTPFYATSGGQKGDDGIIKTKSGEALIFETKKFANGLFVHFVSEIKGEIKAGEEAEAIVNEKNRAKRAQNHSATHLMHKALKEVLGNAISQKGSNVDAAYLTFDFNLNRAMTAEEIKKVEDLVNDEIKKGSAVATNIMDLEEARQSGAEALFGEKYDAKVRVVKMGPSVELCGGTHVKNTAEIKIFKIISEKGIAAGIRRIEACSNEGAEEYLFEQEEAVKNLVKDLLEKNEKKAREILEMGGSAKVENALEEKDLLKLSEILQQELKRKDKEIERLKKQILLSDLKNLKTEEVNGVVLACHIFKNTEAKDLREIINEVKLRKEFSNKHIFAFFACKDDKVSVCVAISSDLTNQFDAAKLITTAVEAVGGKGGGGKKDLAMGGGSNPRGIDHAIVLLKELIKK